MDTTILTLGVDSSQVGTAAAALQRMAQAGNIAEASAQKVSFAATAQGKALATTIVPASKSAAAVGALAASSADIKPNALAQVAASLGLTAAQASKAHAEIERVNRAIASAPQYKTTTAAVRAPLTASAPIASIGAQRFLAPTGIPQLSREADQAHASVARLTAAARDQSAALAQLSPEASRAAGAYRQLSGIPASFAAGLAGVTANTKGATEAAGRFAGAQRESTKASRQAMLQNQQLAFQLNDFFVQVASGSNPMVALIQQGSQLSGTYGGIGNAVKAVTSLVTPARLAFGGAATAVGVLAYQFNQAQKQSQALANSVLLSGNAAGQTEGKVNALAQAVSNQTKATASNVREMAQALIASGQIGPQVFDQATQAAVVYQQITGKAADETAKDFAQMAQAPTQYAAKLGAVSFEQYKVIKALEDGGDKIGATAALFGALAGKADEVNSKLPFMEERMRFLARDFDNLGTALRGVFNPTTEQQIAKIQSHIDALRSGKSMDWRTLLGLDNADAIAEAEGKLAGLNAKLKAEQGQAATDSTGQDAKDAEVALQPLRDRVNPQQVFDREKAKYQTYFAQLAAAGKPVSKAEQDSLIAQLKKQILPKAPKSRGNSEAGQVLRAQLDSDLNSIQQLFERERDAYGFQNRFLQGQYQAGAISLKEFYDAKRKTAEQSVNAEISAMEKERARLEQFKKQTKDPSEKQQTQNRIDDIESQIDSVRLNAARDVELANQEEAASYKALDEQVNSYRASLLELAGDEDGAAKIRIASALAAARQLSQQSDGKISEDDVNAMARLSLQQQTFNRLQREASILSQNAARAEDAYVLSAEQHGKSLVETERGVVRIRTEELAQLGALTRQAQELAKVSADPRIKQFAADLTLEYAKAADAIDPALNRLREANRELAAGLAGTIANFPTAFADAYRQRQSAANDDVRKQKDEYTRRIDQLRGYLAETQDMQDKAKLRAEIKELEGKRAGVKGKSGSSNAFGAFKDAVLEPIGQQVFASFSKVLIQDPLQKMLENQLKGMTEGGGLLAGFFKDALGIKDDPKLAAEQQQTASITASTQALDLLTRAAQSAAVAVRTPAGGALPAGADIPAVDGELAGAQEDAAGAADNLGQNALSAASDLTRFAASAGVGGDALTRLPGIIGLFQSAVAMMSVSGGGKSDGGTFGLIGSVIGAFASGGTGASSGTVLNEVYHKGGIVGTTTDSRTMSASVLAGATRYHTGGIAGLKADEVPAVLMGGPKGKREEVLTADDPRHRDKLGMNALAAIMKESKHEGLRVKGARELGGPVSANSMYRVNEKKRPELLEVAGKQYLMTGAQGGKVTDPGADRQQGGITNINVQVTPPAGADRRTAQQFGAEAARAAQRHLIRS